MDILELIRYGVFGLFVVASSASLGAWAVRTRRINPFGRTANLIRRSTDPVLTRIENWLHRRGGNPQHAEAWLFGGTVVGGIVVISGASFIADIVGGVIATARQGRPTLMFRALLVLAGQLVSVALLIRVIGSWIGWHRHTSFMRPVFLLTDWIVEPLRRFIPPLGMVDVTPFVAFLLIRLVVSLIG